jgi:hypothetical protein
MEFCMLLKRLQVFVACLVLALSAMPLQANTGNVAKDGLSKTQYVMLGGALVAVVAVVADKDKSSGQLAAGEGDQDTDTPSESTSSSSSSSTPTSNNSASSSSSSGT